ncbi:MAG: ATP-grasp domain-containing protein [Spartobacteria bacterium]
MKILFLGASRLVGLLERFQNSARELGTLVEMFTFEDKNPWHAVGAERLAKVIPAPRFEGEDFNSFIIDFVQREKIDIVIPNIDKATVVLSKVADVLTRSGAAVICSCEEVCIKMADKKSADEVFKDLHLPVPGSAKYPLLAKPRGGASSRGIVRFNDQEERSFWASRHKESDYVVQEFIAGTEYSLDAYVSATGATIGIVCRTRDIVAEGEVMVSRTQHAPEAEAIAAQLLSWSKWRGPLTVQVMHDGEKAWLLECNPRFGSGVPLSIEAGLDIPNWILRERLGLPLPESPLKWRDGLCMTRYRKEKFLWL